MFSRKVIFIDSTEQDQICLYTSKRIDFPEIKNEYVQHLEFGTIDVFTNSLIERGFEKEFLTLRPESESVWRNVLHSNFLFSYRTINNNPTFLSTLYRFILYVVNIREMKLIEESLTANISHLNSSSLTILSECWEITWDFFEKNFKYFKDNYHLLFSRPSKPIGKLERIKDRRVIPFEAIKRHIDIIPVNIFRRHHLQNISLSFIMNYPEVINKHMDYIYNDYKTWDNMQNRGLFTLRFSPEVEDYFKRTFELKNTFASG